MVCLILPLKLLSLDKFVLPGDYGFTYKNQDLLHE